MRNRLEKSLNSAASAFLGNRGEGAGSIAGGRFVSRLAERPPEAFRLDILAP